MTRDRLQTEQRLVDTIHEIVTNEGFDKLRINKIARAAAVNKILIYRYFGGLQGLINAYYEKHKTAEKIKPIDLDQLKDATIDEFFDVCCSYILNAFRELRRNPQTLELLRSYLADGKLLPDSIQQQIHDFYQTVDRVSEVIQTRHGRAFTTIIGAGLTQLLFVAQGKRQVMGIDLSTDEGWEIIEQGVRQIFYCVAVATRERLGSHVPMP